MNTNQLASFLVLEQEQSYQKTALRLHYSRSTLLDHIRNLEEELGVKLFQKSGRNIVLTADGKRFHVHAQDMMDIYQQALLDAGNSASEQHLRILTTETPGLYFLPLPCTQLLSQYPDMDLSIQFGPRDSFCSRLRNGDADVAFAFSGKNWGHISGEEFRCISICREPVVFFTNPKSELAHKTQIEPKDLTRLPFILTSRDGTYSELLNQICKKEGIRIPSRQYIDSGSLLKQCVMANNCVSMVSRRVIEMEVMRGELTELPWQGEPMWAEIIAVSPNNDLKNPALERLIRYAKTLLSKQ